MWLNSLFRCGILMSMSLLSIHASPDLAYFCYPNSTVVIENPGSYTAVFANNSFSICSTSAHFDYQVFVVKDCAMDIDVLVSFNNRTDIEDNILGGLNITSHIINCNNIPENGVFRTIANGLVPIFDPEQSMIYPTFPITSTIYTDDTETVLAVNATIGTPLSWIIDGPEKYNMRPEECIAFDGMEVSGNVTNKTIILNGCSQDADLVQDFNWYNGTYGGKLKNIIYAFRFYTSSVITISCNVRICINESDSCTINCTDTSRKRRDAVTESDKIPDVVQTQTKLFVFELEGDNVYSETSSIECECLWFIAVAFLLDKI